MSKFIYPIDTDQFQLIREQGKIYVDKTGYIHDLVNVRKYQFVFLARPRRFGKTLNLSMVEQFFSLDYEGKGELFEGLSIWKDEGYRKLQGTYPVISLSFARVKEINYENTRIKICEIIRNLYIKSYNKTLNI